MKRWKERKSQGHRPQRRLPDRAITESHSGDSVGNKNGGEPPMGRSRGRGATTKEGRPLGRGRQIVNNLVGQISGSLKGKDSMPAPGFWQYAVC